MSDALTQELNNFERGLIQELLQSYWTIEFLYGCLEHPNDYKHSYPEQTRERLKHLREVIDRSVGGVPQSCPHSCRVTGCESCEYWHKFRSEHQFDHRLGW